MAKYDTISKHLIKIYPQAIVRLALGRDDVEVDEVLETELPMVETRLTDADITHARPFEPGQLVRLKHDPGNRRRR